MENKEVIKVVMLLNDISEAKEIRTNIHSFLEDATIYIAKNFDDFIKTIAHQKTDCFVLDWNYLECSSTLLAEKLRKSRKHHNSTIVFVTEKEQGSLPMQYSALDVDMVLTKPFDFKNFEENFRLCLQNKFKPIIPEHFNVLVLDNNPDILTLMSAHLIELKHEKYITCTSIKEAKELIEKNDFDLFLLDWNLDDGTCIDLIEFIRSKKDRTRLLNSLVMVITGRDAVDDIMTLLRYDVKDHIIKPFDFNEFEEKLKYAMIRHLKPVNCK